MFFASRKMGEAVACRTALQLDLCALLEVDSTVKRFSAFPDSVEVAWRGTRLRLQPDFLILGCPDDAQGTPPHLYLKICGAAEWASEWPAAKIRAAEDALSPPGSVIRLTTESLIRRQPRLANVRLLLRYRAFAPDPRLVQRTEDAVRSEVLRLADLLPDVSRAEVFATVAALVLRDRIGLDLDVRLGPDSILQLQPETAP